MNFKTEILKRKKKTSWLCTYKINFYYNNPLNKNINDFYKI